MILVVLRLGCSRAELMLEEDLFFICRQKRISYKADSSRAGQPSESEGVTVPEASGFGFFPSFDLCKRMNSEQQERDQDV